MIPQEKAFDQAALIDLQLEEAVEVHATRLEKLF